MFISDNDTSAFVNTDYYNKVLSELLIEINDIKNEIADGVLFSSAPKQKDAYAMSYDEYVELPYRSRL